MCVILTVTLPHKPFNAALKNGTAGKKIGRILEATKPEAVYFTDNNGQRSALIIVEMADASGIPALCEPWMLTFEADVQFRIAMTPDDLKKAGLDKLGKKWG